MSEKNQSQRGGMSQGKIRNLRRTDVGQNLTLAPFYLWNFGQAI